MFLETAAGDITVASAGAFGASTIRISDSHSSMVTLVNRGDTKPSERTGKAVLIFHRVGDQYFLSRIVSGRSSDSLELPASRNEKELSKTASLGNYETVAILASL